MRGIKLRAWDIKGNQYWGATEGDWKIELHDGHSPQLFIFDYECEHGSWIEIEDVVFEEYTGLKDKDGREIYEGDIVKWGHTGGSYYSETPHRIAVVQFNPDIQYRIVNYKYCRQEVVFHHGNFLYAKQTDKALEIIGNIYENPELLEAAE